MPPQTILVVDATGKQGSEVIKALLDHPESPLRYTILGLTRKAESPHTKALAGIQPGTTFVEGDITIPGPIFAPHPRGSIEGLFLNTIHGSPTPEEQQAIPFIDAAVEHGVKRIVFSSVDRGGDEKSWTNPTNVEHFRAKHNIELYLRDKAEKENGRFVWTILRSVANFDNLDPGLTCPLFAAMWFESLSPETKIQFVGSRDIGLFAAMAFDDPAQWSGKAVGLAGDEMTLDEAMWRFEKVTGKELPQSYAFLGKASLWAIDEVGEMFAFWEEEGYGADLQARKGEAPMQDFETWLAQDSQWFEG
ncbi:hypothetical protein NEMBOFW57_009580 [Staphylotrichum longicolle]|uniref:NmrA-like domain-containing protein n=1 Tax=Staphylotrichum longicolle TaxID=669026 RepID=A0AAD4EPN2_9PEZI|nr:hypothetical protein NEMBOFW57_009580 [Staphylotrichum longicolle]